jgi:1,4-alpha-glucan branching enzyme
MITFRDDGRVEFKFYRPGATDVRIAGDFDGWQGTIPMRNAGRGWWLHDAQIPAGEYRFRYRADGHWFTDFAAFGVEQNKDGGWNSVLIVPEMEIAAEVSGTVESEEQEYEALRMAA